jgi:hypothetical protein
MCIQVNADARVLLEAAGLEYPGARADFGSQGGLRSDYQYLAAMRGDMVRRGHRLSVGTPDGATLRRVTVLPQPLSQAHDMREIGALDLGDVRLSPRRGDHGVRAQFCDDLWAGLDTGLNDHVEVVQFVCVPVEDSVVLRIAFEFCGQSKLSTNRRLPFKYPDAVSLPGDEPCRLQARWSGPYHRNGSGWSGMACRSK